MNDISASLPSVEHFNNNGNNESRAFGDAGSIVDKKSTKFPLSDTCPKFSSFTTKDESSFASTKDRTSSCSGDRSGFSADTNLGPVIKAAVNDVLCLDCAVSQREQVEAIKVTPFIVLSLAEDQDVPILELKDVGKVSLKDYVTHEEMPLNAAEDAMHRDLETIGVCDQLQMQSNKMETNLEDRDVSILEVKDDEKVFLKDYVTNDQMPLRAAEDAMHSSPETKVCDHLGLQLNQMKTSLALLDSNCSSRSETPSENESSTKLSEWNDCEVAQGTYLSSSCGQIDQNAPTLEFSKSSNLHKYLGADLVSEETKSAPLWTEESKGAQGATRHLKKVGPLVHVGRAGAANFSSQSIQDDDRSLSEKWHVDTDATEGASTTFSGPIPFSGPISYSGAVSYSGLISYSGQIPYSGSISLRSESSTTSTRSFAFPILASEWNSSPVTMPQPDRRYLRRRWRWRCCCICCRRPSTLFD